MKIGECVRLGVMRKDIKGIFERKKIVLKLPIKVLKCFNIFLESIHRFLFFNEFSNFLLLFSCCPADLESIRIF